MNIIEKIEAQWLSYVSEVGHVPRYLFLGNQEMAELDKHNSMITFVYRGMEIAGANEESHCSVGNKYNEIV